MGTRVFFAQSRCRRVAKMEARQLQSSTVSAKSLLETCEWSDNASRKSSPDHLYSLLHNRKQGHVFACKPEPNLSEQWPFFASGVGGFPLYPEIFYFITHWSCSASGSLWEMPDSNPGPLPQKSGALSMSHHISSMSHHISSNEPPHQYYEVNELF